MKAFHWFALVAVIFVARWIAPDTNNTKSATDKYLTECNAVIEKASQKAETEYFTSTKLSTMEKAFEEATKIEPPRGADQGAVTRMRHTLKEGCEFFASADGTWTKARDFVLGFIGGAADVSGGSGFFTGTLLAMKSLEISGDEAERREFIEASKEFERYYNDKY